MRNIYFYYKNNIVGGAEFLFIRTANFLSQSRNIKVGYIFKTMEKSCLELLNNNVEKIIVPDSNCIVLPENSTIITNPTLLYRMPQIKSKNTFLLFWILHPDDFYRICFWLANPIVRRDTINRAKTMIDLNALIAMDEATRIAFKNFSSYDLDDKHIIPVMLEDYPSPPLKQKLINEQCLNIGWIGRLSDDKIYALINLMDNLEKINIHKKVKLHIIGKGDSEHLLKKYDNFEVIMLGTIKNQDLSSYIENNLDLVFAMGTSMLEAEKCAIPAVMVFYILKESAENRFLWTFKLKNYTLGYSPEFKLVPENEIMTLEQIINDFLANIPQRSKQAREHFESFLMEKHINKLLDCVNQTSYSPSTLKKEKFRAKIIRLKYRWIYSIKRRLKPSISNYNYLRKITR